MQLLSNRLVLCLLQGLPLENRLPPDIRPAGIGNNPVSRLRDQRPMVDLVLCRGPSLSRIDFWQRSSHLHTSNDERVP